MHNKILATRNGLDGTGFESQPGKNFSFFEIIQTSSH